MHGGIGQSVDRPLVGVIVEVASREQVAELAHWRRAFDDERKDHRFYELVEATPREGFAYGYLVVRDGADVRAIQPYFIIDQDLVAGASPRLRSAIESLRRLWPRFMRARTLMIGCSAGEGHL